jgi:hypothetical protein
MVVAMDTHTSVAHNYCNLDKEGLLVRKVVAIHILGMMDSPLELHNLQRVHNWEQRVDSYTLEESDPEADILDRMDTLDKQAEREALPRDVRLENQKRVRDRAFGDRRMFLEQHR